MAFRVYKPRESARVRAEQLTKDNAQEIAVELMGRLIHGENVRGEKPNIIGLQIPTFEDPQEFNLGQWVVRNEDGTIVGMSPEDFDKAYELARTTRAA